MAEVPNADAQQPEIDHEMLDIGAEAPIDVSDKIEIVSALLVPLPPRSVVSY